MDKFATKNGIDQGGVRTKRTKTVLRKKTYMDEKGYMKMVNEEVEVTDDEVSPSAHRMHDGENSVMHVDICYLRPRCW